MPNLSDLKRFGNWSTSCSLRRRAFCSFDMLNGRSEMLVRGYAGQVLEGPGDALVSFALRYLRIAGIECARDWAESQLDVEPKRVRMAMRKGCWRTAGIAMLLDWAE